MASVSGTLSSSRFLGLPTLRQGAMTHKGCQGKRTRKVKRVSLRFLSGQVTASDVSRTEISSSGLDHIRASIISIMQIVMSPGKMSPCCRTYGLLDSLERTRIKRIANVSNAANAMEIRLDQHMVYSCYSSFVFVLQGSGRVTGVRFPCWRCPEKSEVSQHCRLALKLNGKLNGRLIFRSNIQIIK